MSSIEVTKPDEVIAHLKQLYLHYIQTENIDEKAHFFSPTCRQICRPTPSFAATERSTIVQHLHNTAGKDAEAIQDLMDDPVEGLEKQTTPSERTGSRSESIQKRSFYSIRPLREDEAEFGTDAMVQPAGYLSTEEIERVAKTEGWVGMRVDL